MEGLIDAKRRSAIPSWSGYQYQGHIALITMLIQLVELKQRGGEVENYEIAVEDVEDFSIYQDGKLKSIHQVKAEKKETVSSYGEAFYYMAMGLETAESEEVIAYLHTSEELNYDEWKQEVISAVKKFVPEKKRELETLLKDSKKMSAKVAELKARIAKRTGMLSRSKGPVWNAICDGANMEKPEDITEQNLKGAIENYLKRFKTIDIEALMNAGRLKLYRYSKDCTNIRIVETEKIIEKLIEKYWGEELKDKRAGNSTIYRLYIQELIEENVAARHTDNRIERKISFSVFSKKLDSEIGTVEEQRILENKDMFFRWKKEFCYDECEKMEQCEKCDLAQKAEWFSSMNLERLKNAFYMMSPNVLADISKEAAWLINEEGIINSVFLALKNMQQATEDSSGMMLYEKNKRYLLTDIMVNRKNKDKLQKRLSSNTTIENVCKNLVKNRDLGAKRMEIDSLIVYSCNGAEEINNIENLSGDTGNLGGMRDELIEAKKREPSYMKITNKKTVSLIDAEKFIKDCGGEINEV